MDTEAVSKSIIEPRYVCTRRWPQPSPPSSAWHPTVGEQPALTSPPENAKRDLMALTSASLDALGGLSSALLGTFNKILRIF